MPPRKTAAPLARPAQRYFKGKAPRGADAAGSEDSDSDVAQEVADAVVDVPIGGEASDESEEEKPVTKKVAAAPKKTLNIALKNVEVQDGKVIVDGRLESGRTEVELAKAEESSAEEEAESQEEESSSEEESESEEEPPRPMFRPVFVPKRGRETVSQREAESINSEEAIQKREKEAEERKKQSLSMVADSIRRELAEKETPELVPDVDDTDGLDPTAEFEAWRLRELGRIKRDKEMEMQRELERLEIERRRAMPEEQRMKEDLERAKKLRDEKPKGQQKFLQKYWHKGAFHQDAEILKRHDFTEATESTVDVSLLPKVMQVKNFGKRSQTKYTHLLDQDTTVGTGGFGGTGPIKGGPGGAQGCFLCGGPHLKKDCPQNIAGPSGANGGFGTGSNSAPSAPRKWGGNPGDERPKSWRDRDDEDGPRRDRPRDTDRRENDQRADRYRRDDDRDRRKQGDMRDDVGRRDYRRDDRRDDRRDGRREERRDRRRSRSRSRSRSPGRDKWRGEGRRRSISRDDDRTLDRKRRRYD